MPVFDIVSSFRDAYRLQLYDIDTYRDTELRYRYSTDTYRDTYRIQISKDKWIRKQQSLFQDIHERHIQRSVLQRFYAN